MNRRSNMQQFLPRSWRSLVIRSAVVAVIVMTGDISDRIVEAQDSKPSAAKKPAEPAPPPARKKYKGREIAQTMHYAGAPWLIRNEREREERASEMLKALAIKPGMTVCDLGCGNGFHSIKLAKMVGPKGKVLAVDIQQGMLRLLQARAGAAGITNVQSILSLPHDPKLPEGKVDLILLVDVYHELSHPELLLKAMRKSLKKDGRIALVEYRTEDPKVPIKRLHKMSKQQINKEFPPIGFKLVQSYDKLPWQHLMFFQRAEKAAGKK